MIERTALIEKKEEEYIDNVAGRNVTKEEPLPPSPIPWVALLVLRYSMYGVLAAVLLGLYALYELHFSKVGSNMSPVLFYVLLGVLGGLLLSCVVTWITVVRASNASAKFVGILCVVFIASLGFVLHQLHVIQTSQSTFYDALDAPYGDLAQEDKTLILNGGHQPSMWTRFSFDGPAWFLSWLESRCTKANDDGRDDVDYVDDSDFFAVFWKGKTQKCARRTLKVLMRFEDHYDIAIIILLAVYAFQVVLVLLFLWTHESIAAPSRKKRKKPKSSKKNKSTQDQSGSQPAALLSLISFVVALAGAGLGIFGIFMLQSCDFQSEVNWYLVGITAAGIVMTVAALCASFRWKTNYVTLSLLVMASLAWRIHSGTLKMEEQLPDVSNHARLLSFLRDMYNQTSNQTCQPVVRWMLHTCIRKNDSIITPFTGECQDEYVELVHTSLPVVDGVVESLAGLLMLLTCLVLLPMIKDACRKAFIWCCATQVQVPADAPVYEGNNWTHEDFSLEDAVKRYSCSIRSGDDAVKAAEIRLFNQELAKMTGRRENELDSSVKIFKHQLDAIIRVLVLRRLTTRCKCDVSLSVSKDGKWIHAKIFLSDNLLMTTLCQQEYKLQFADAVDPGPSFWHDKREIKNDLKVMDVHSAKGKLKLLLSKEIISRKEAVIFPMETPRRMSARLNVLLRSWRMASGSLVCTNRHPAFALYRPRADLQYLYKRYPNRLDLPGTFRRSAVLRTVDCLRIAATIIEAEFDIDRMLDNNVIGIFTCLHGASRFDYNNQRSLFKSWITFWKPFWLPGEFSPHTHWFLNRLGRLHPFRQPLQAVRDYFGENIAFYFAWSGFYGQCLVVPALLAIPLFVSMTTPSSLVLVWNFLLGQDSDLVHSKQPPLISQDAVVFSYEIILWGFFFIKLWERRSVWYQLEWGMRDLNLDLKDRVNFRGEERRNPVTQEVELHFSTAKRLRLQIESLICVLVLTAINLLVIVALLLAEGYFASWIGLRLAVLLSSLCLGFLAKWNSDNISHVAHRLSERENYQNDKDFEQSVIYKVFFMQLVNTYSPVWIIAFADMKIVSHTFLGGLYREYEVQEIGMVNKIVQINILVLLIFIVRLSSHLLEIIHEAAKKNANLANRESASAKKPFLLPSVDDEIELDTYGGSYEDYTELIVQFGLVVMFSSVCPLIPVLALVECMLEIRLDALNLCQFTRRPTPDIADGIGPWSSCAHMLLRIGVIMNFAFVYFMASNHASQQLVQRASAFMLHVVAALLLFEILWFLFPSTSRQAEEVMLRNEYLLERYFGEDSSEGFDDDPSHHAVVKDIADMGLSDDEGGSQPETSVADHMERYSLLRRLNVVLRKHAELKDFPDPVEFGAQDSTERLSVADSLEENGGERTVSKAERSSVSREPSAAYRDEPTNSRAGHSSVSREPSMVSLSSSSSEEWVVGYTRRPTPQLAPRLPPVEESFQATIDVAPAAESPRGSVDVSLALVPRERSVSSEHSIERKPSSAESSQEPPSLPPIAITVAPPRPKDDRKPPLHPPSSSSSSSESSMAVRVRLPQATPPVPTTAEASPAMGARRTSMPWMSSSSSSSSSSSTIVDQPKPVRKSFTQMFSRKAKAPAPIITTPPESPPPSLVAAPAAVPPPQPSAPPLPEPTASENVEVAAPTQPKSQQALPDPEPARSDPQPQSSVDATPPMATKRTSVVYQQTQLTGMDAVAEATNRNQFDFNSDELGRRRSIVARRTPSNLSRKMVPNSSRASIARTSCVGFLTPAMQASLEASASASKRTSLSGIDAVREASRRNKFDFSGDSKSGWE